MLDGSHSVPAYWYGKHRAASLFGTGPCYGTNASQFMGWFYNGGGQELYDELTQKILGLNVQGFYVFAMPTQPLGWFKKELKGPDDFKGMKYRTVGLASNVMQAMGASVAQLPGPEILPAMEKGVIEAFEFNNPTSDMRFGGAGRGQVLLSRLLPPGVGSHRGRVQQDEVGRPWQGTAAGPASRRPGRQFLRHLEGVGHLLARSADADQTSTACTSSARPKRSSRPSSWPGTRWSTEISSDANQGPFIKKVLESQKAWGKRVGFYAINNEADYKSAYEHYFGPMKV